MTNKKSREPTGAILPDGSRSEWDERLRAVGATPVYDELEAEGDEGPDVVMEGSSVHGVQGEAFKPSELGQEPIATVVEIELAAVARLIEEAKANQGQPGGKASLMAAEVAAGRFVATYHDLLRQALQQA